MEKKQSPVEYLVSEIENIGFAVNNTLEFYDTVQIAKEMEETEYKKRFVKELNPGLFSSPYAIEPTPKITREEVWINAWCALANTWNCETSETATKWADKCLIEFDKRFTNK